MLSNNIVVTKMNSLRAISTAFLVVEFFGIISLYTKLLKNSDT